MSQLLVFLAPYVAVIAVVLIVAAVVLPSECSKYHVYTTFRDIAPITAAITFTIVTLTLGVFLGAVHIWGNLYYPQRCHGCGELITDAYYQVDEWRWHPGCFTESATYHSAETPSWQFPPEQEAPSDPAVVKIPHPE